MITGYFHGNLRRSLSNQFYTLSNCFEGSTSQIMLNHIIKQTFQSHSLIQSIKKFISRFNKPQNITFNFRTLQKFVICSFSSWFFFFVLQMLQSHFFNFNFHFEFLYFHFNNFTKKPIKRSEKNELFIIKFHFYY